ETAQNSDLTERTRQHIHTDLLVAAAAVTAQDLAFASRPGKGLRAINRLKQRAQVFAVMFDLDRQRSLTRRGWIRAQRQDHPAAFSQAVSQFFSRGRKFVVTRFEQAIDGGFGND